MNEHTLSTGRSEQAEPVEGRSRTRSWVEKLTKKLEGMECSRTWSLDTIFVHSRALRRAAKRSAVHEVSVLSNAFDTAPAISAAPSAAAAGRYAAMGSAAWPAV